MCTLTPVQYISQHMEENRYNRFMLFVFVCVWGMKKRWGLVVKNIFCDVKKVMHIFFILILCIIRLDGRDVQSP